MAVGYNARSREEKENDTLKGCYTPVDDSHLEQNLSPYDGQRLSTIVPILGLLFSAVPLMVLHHFFYIYLREKRIDSGTMELPSLLRSQRNVNVVGTIIAHGARVVLSTVICANFARVFWETLQSRSHTIAQIDALVNCGQSPFRPSVLRAASASFALFFISLAASATALVVVLSPGSLTIDPDFTRRTPCIAPTVPRNAMASDYAVQNNNFFSETQQAFLEGIVSSYTYLPPFQGNTPISCGGGIFCSYNVSFLAPALTCVDVTNQTDLSSLSSPSDNVPGLPFTIWNITSIDIDVVGITILSRDLEKDLLQANNCTAYNATYDISIGLQEGSAIINVWNVTQGSVLSVDGSFMSNYGMSAMEMLSALCDNLPGDPGFCLNSPFFVATPTGNHTFREPVSDFAIGFMQNISLSLLSGDVYYGLSNDTATNFQYVNSVCSSVVTVYVYNPVRLLSTYGVALAVTVMIVAYGCTRRRGPEGERNLVLSNLLRITMNEKMVAFGRKMCFDGRTQVQLSVTGPAQHKLIPVALEDPPTGFNSSEFTTRLSTFSPPIKRISASQWKMLVLLLATVSCMILNHAYYHYLDGKTPSLPLRLDSSGWLLNQTVASDVGIGLAYAGQTFLAVAMATSCVQLFWRVVRRQWLAVHQIDNLMKTHTNPFNFSLFSALRISMGVTLVALLAASTSVISIFAPGSIKVAPDHNHSEDCTILAPRDLSALATNSTAYENVGGNIVPALTVESSGTYLPPINVCGSEPSKSQCSYTIQFIGPGFACEDVTASSDFTAFSTSQGQNTITLSTGEVIRQTDVDQPWQFSLQTWDRKSSVYQAVNCTGVLRSYTMTISHSAISTINVTDSRIVSTVIGNMSQPVTFAENYLQDILNLFGNDSSIAFLNLTSGEVETNLVELVSFTGAIGTTQLDGNVTFKPNMTLTLEEFAQNASLSILSGQVASLDPNIPDILENVTTTCTYTFTAYEYSPMRLFLTYGIGLFVAMLCALWGSVAIRQNGVDEAMDFSRLLRAVLNERMFDAKESLDKDTVVKADETVEGALAPVESS